MHDEGDDVTYAVHVDSVRVSPGVLVELDEPRGQRLRNEVEADELADAGKHLAVVLSALVHSQHHRRHVAEYRRTHQRYNTAQHSSTSCQ